MIVRRYSLQDKSVWDQFVRNSKNGTFLFERDYMDYHSDRFADHSLMCYDDKERLMALLPANQDTQTGDLYSHQGLTYGGFVFAPDIHGVEVGQLFEEVKDYLRTHSFQRWHYKPMPTIYHRVPSEEDEYFLWRNNAQLEVCNLASTIDLRSSVSVPVEQRRRRGFRKAQQRGYRVSEIFDLSKFWPIVIQNLRDTYHVAPVHTLAEIQQLKSHFPQQIRCFVVSNPEGTIEGGIVVQESSQVVHSQYPHATQQGKNDGVMDLLFMHLLDYYQRECPSIRYFDFGTSNEQRGLFLNPTLIAQKEGFGGRGVAYKTYLLTL